MSGPIVRKYGFPNFEKIFGDRALKHGIDDAEGSVAQPPSTPPAPPERSAEPNEPDDPATATKVAPSTEFGSAVG